MRTASMMAGGLWAVGLAAIATIFYISVSRGFLIGAVEFGAVIVGFVVLVGLLGAGLVNRKVLDRTLLNPPRGDLNSGGVLVFGLALTAGLAAQFPEFPWPAGVLGTVLLTAGFHGAQEVRQERIGT